MQPTLEAAYAPPVFVPLYSKLAVRLFAVLFSPIFGGIMAYHNLRDLGRTASAKKVLWGSLFFTAVALVVAFTFPRGLITTGLNIAGAIWLGNYHEQLVPSAGQHPRKSIWKLLLISLAISVLGLGAVLAPRWLV